MKTKQTYILLSAFLNLTMFFLLSYGNTFWSKIGILMLIVNFMYTVSLIQYYENQKNE
jgi:hypothetical protein